MLASHGLRHVWQDFPAGKRDVFHLAVGNLSSFFVQPLDDPLREILPPWGKDPSKGSLLLWKSGMSLIADPEGCKAGEQPVE